MKCDQDLCLNLWYDLNKLLWQDELNPRVRCAFGNVLKIQLERKFLHQVIWEPPRPPTQGKQNQLNLNSSHVMFGAAPSNPTHSICHITCQAMLWKCDILTALQKKRHYEGDFAFAVFVHSNLLQICYHSLLPTKKWAGIQAKQLPAKIDIRSWLCWRSKHHGWRNPLS